MLRRFADIVLWLSQPSTMVALGGMVAAVGGIAAAIGGYRYAQEEAGFERTLRERAEANAAFEKSMRERVEETLSNITGGDGYARAEPVWFALSPRGLRFLSVTNDGRFPVYDLQVRVEDITKRMVLFRQDIEKYGTPYDRTAFDTTTINVGTLGSSQTILKLGEMHLPDDALEQRYMIWLTARNGFVRQDFLFRRTTTSEDWQVATRIAIRDRPETEDVPKGFPRDAKGKVWE